MGVKAHAIASLCTGKKPMARASRVSMFSRRIEIDLSSAAIDLLFSRAQVLSEGQIEDGEFFGSTMVTFDLGRANGVVSDDCDAITVKRLGMLCANDPRIRERARQLGAREASKSAGRPVRAPEVDIRVRAHGTLLHLDLDIEGIV